MFRKANLLVVASAVVSYVLCQYSQPKVTFKQGTVVGVSMAWLLKIPKTLFNFEIFSDFSFEMLETF